MTTSAQAGVPDASRSPGRAERLRAALGRPIPAESLAAYRILFGTLLFLSTVRFMASGWIEIFYVQPAFHFKYYGFGWVKVLPEEGMWLLYGGIAASALLVALGLFYRAAIAAFLGLFAYAELTDVTNYLNHYYLVTLLALLMTFLPMNARGSLDARRRPDAARAQVPAWTLWLLRFQVGIVYVHAGLAKLGSDWLLHAQPLGIWLKARDETPVLGPLFALPETAYLFSWGGLLFDTTIVAWLLWKRTRPFAFAAVLVFHGLTQILFDIGIFPALMAINATLFFEPDWPSRIAARLRRRAPPAPAPGSAVSRPPPRWAQGALLAYGAFQVLFPFRHWLYPGDVLWNEQGMRWAWKVMLREKSGSVTYHVRDPRTGRSWQVSPSEYLTPRQELEMSGQPDLILQLAHHVAGDLRRKGHGEVEVRAEAKVSLNGRPSRLMIDPAVDLARVRDGLGAARWILPGPTDLPLRANPTVSR
ncbi:MAG TPA: HTTM domain-containing protein [Planctomycetota bacterium]|nr:HTTM domain-containing protein [Planctomycetota bacterium]